VNGEALYNPKGFKRARASPSASLPLYKPRPYVSLFKDARMVSRAYFKPRAVKKCSLSLYHFPSEHEKTPCSVTVLDLCV
jgi:hypothetical protein